MNTAQTRKDGAGANAVGGTAAAPVPVPVPVPLLALVLALPLALAAAASGCKRAPIDENVGVTPADVRGTVGGLVLDATSGDPLPDLTVTVRGGATSATATTGADGSFSAGDDDPGPGVSPGLPAGGTLQVAVDGAAAFTSASLVTSLPVAAGDVPLDAPSVAVGPVGLVPRTLEIVVQVLRDDGQPFEGVEVQATTAVAWVSFASGSPIGAGSWSTSTMTTSGGYATFTALPDVAALPPSVSDAITFNLPAQDLDGDGFPEFDGASTTRAARSLGAGLVVMTVNSIDLPLQVVSSNVPGLVTGGVTPDSVPAVLDGIDAVRLVFNQPLDPALLSVTVTDEDGTSTVMVTTGPPAGAANLVVSSPPGTWLTGAEYNVVVHAVSAGSSPPRVYDGWGAFFTAPAVPGVVATAARDPSTPGLIHVSFTEPVGVAPGTLWSLGGGSCPVFVQYDLNVDGDLADDSEIDGATCSITLTSNEPNPSGPAGLSGYTTEAYFFAPSGFPASPVVIDLRFSRAASSGAVLRTAAGAVVPDQPVVTVL
ncbi:MAG TPA: hypothetical protein VG389_18415 [Myxococcota bacterium]|nr:hypothetical protein [Myxococcota bacterium]